MISKKYLLVYDQVITNNGVILNGETIYPILGEDDLNFMIELPELDDSISKEYVNNKIFPINISLVKEV